MTDFTVESGIRIPDREKRDAKRDLQQSIGDVTIDVDAAQGGPGEGGSAASLAGGAGALDELGDQTDILTNIHQELEKIGVSGGGSGGGGSLFGGTSGVAIGSVLGGGSGGLLGTVLGKGKSGLGSLLKGRGSLKGLIGRSPFTMLSQTAGRRDVSDRAGEGASGPVTGAMSDIATGEFQLKEDFWPDLSPPDNLWSIDLSPPDGIWSTLTSTLSPPESVTSVWTDITESLSPPKDVGSVWNDITGSLSPPEDATGLWGQVTNTLSPPDNLWGIDLSPPNDLWGIDLSPPDNLWNVDLSPPDNLWPSIELPSSGIWSVLNPNSGSNGRVPEGTQDPVGRTTATRRGSQSFESFGRPVSLSNNTSSSSQTSSSPSMAEPRVDVVIQEVAARIESGRTLEDALRTELDAVTPEIKNEVLAQVRDDMPNRL